MEINKQTCKNHLSPYLCGYRRSFSTQHALLSLIERWKNFFDDRGFGETVLIMNFLWTDQLNFESWTAHCKAYVSWPH